MNVKLISVVNKGDLEKEAVWLDVTDDADVGKYVLCDTTYTDEEAKRVSNRLRHFYWFPDKPVKKGDYVKLYTKTGKPRIAATSGRQPPTSSSGGSRRPSGTRRATVPSSSESLSGPT